MTYVQYLHCYSTCQGGEAKQEPCFNGKMGPPCQKTKFVEATRQALSAAQLPAKDYAGHSFRIGAATTAAMSGLEDSTIQTLGWW